jgi:4-hydroxyproline epimerase
MVASSPPEPTRGARRVHVVDSHTEGEPTRVVVSGGPTLGDGSMSDRRDRFRERYDSFRRAVVCEPRGSEPLVGALLASPHDPAHSAGVVFFDNAGYLGMCGHGTIGLVVTLQHLGRLRPGPSLIETPVGPVRTELGEGNRVTVENVRSFRTRARVTVEVPEYGAALGDVAFGGNWFFIIDSSPQELRIGNVRELTEYSLAVRSALGRAGITGGDGSPIEHVELCGPPERTENHARNFVLCPGGAYDRSPCGTGTSAKMACLVADGLLKTGDAWRQEGILGGVFEGRAEPAPDGIRPRITGSAHITSESDLILDEDDPYCYGVPS